jgi:hypothetical protein
MGAYTWKPGADTTNEQKPDWPHLRDAANTTANTFAGDSGWVFRHPWGDETLYAIGNLGTKLGIANLAAIAVLTLAGTAGDGSGKLVNAAAQGLSLVITFNEPVTLSGTPTLDLISGNSANITLSYNAALSDVTQGKVAFGNTSFSLASALYGPDTLTINASSTVTGWQNIKDAATANVVANGVPAAVSLVVDTYQEKPVASAPTRVGTPTNTTNQTLAFAIKFNQAVVLSTTPTVRAIGNANTPGNVVLTYAFTNGTGNLVFSKANNDFSTIVNNGIYTVNATSTLTGWNGIKNAIGGVAANVVVGANTHTIS